MLLVLPIIPFRNSHNFYSLFLFYIIPMPSSIIPFKFLSVTMRSIVYLVADKRV